MATVLETPAIDIPLTAPAPRRSTGLDIARFLGAAAIVWIHTPRSEMLLPTTVLGRFAVPLFTCAAMFFVFDKAASCGLNFWRDYSLSRARRIYLPFLAWSAVYLLFKGAKRFVAPEQDNDFAGIDILWKGGAFHLWFLPFILACSVIAYPLCAIGSKGPSRRNVLALASLALGFAIASVPWTTLPTTDDALIFMWLALPAACWGVTLAAVLRRDEKPSRDTFRAASLLFVGLMAMLIGFGRDPLIENLAGVAGFVAAWNWSPTPRWERFASLGGVAMGMYCSHLLFIKIAESIMAKLQWPITPAADVTVMLFATLGCIFTAWWLSKRRATRWLVV